MRHVLFRAAAVYLALSIAASAAYNLFPAAAWDIASHRHGLVIVSFDQSGVWLLIRFHALLMIGFWALEDVAMLIETYVNIKKNGVLVAFDHRWQYWQCGGVWYSLDVSGNLAGCSVWCAVSQLAHHFRHLCRVTGHRWENRPDLCVVRPDMIPAY